MAITESGAAEVVEKTEEATEELAEDAVSATTECCLSDDYDLLSGKEVEVAGPPSELYERYRG